MGSPARLQACVHGSRSLCIDGSASAWFWGRCDRLWSKCPGPTVPTQAMHWPNVIAAVNSCCGTTPGLVVCWSEQSQLLHAQSQVGLWDRRRFWEIPSRMELEVQACGLQWGGGQGLGRWGGQ